MIRAGCRINCVVVIPALSRNPLLITNTWGCSDTRSMTQNNAIFHSITETFLK